MVGNTPCPYVGMEPVTGSFVGPVRTITAAYVVDLGGSIGNIHKLDP
jgi:hypothetical protein